MYIVLSKGMNKEYNTYEEYFNIDVPVTRKDDFFEFWKETIKQTKNNPLNLQMELMDSVSPYVDTYKIQYNGFDTTRVHCLLLVPNFIKKEHLPCMIHFHGFKTTIHREFAHSYYKYVLMGYCVLVVDLRDQGGTTMDLNTYSSGGFQSVMTKGILDHYEYYYRAVYMDALKAIDVVETLDFVNQEKIVLYGTSQGGGIVMAVASLDSRPSLTIANVPSYSNIMNRILKETGSYKAVADYLRAFPHQEEVVYNTMTYFDTMNMAEQIQCEVYASVGLKDTICPACDYFATYNKIKSKKEILIYPYNNHEGGGNHHEQEILYKLKEWNQI